MAKIKVRHGENEIELDGSDAFIEKQLASFYGRIQLVQSSGVPASPEYKESKRSSKKKNTKKEKKAKKTTRAKSASRLSIVRDLNLKPKSKESFNGFADKKKPGSNQEKCVVAVYYLHTVLQLTGIAIEHVFTCFKDMAWRLPSDLANTLRYTASVKGWLDTGDSSSIKLTTHGENLIEHDLPRKTKEK